MGGDGKVYYFGNGTGIDGKQQLLSLDTKGDGTLKEVTVMPFVANWTSPCVMYDENKVLINDAGTGLWVMDLSKATPTFTKVGDLSQARDYACMTVMADGKVLITGGSAAGQNEAYADKTATIWDPRTNTLTDTVDEAHPRLYHSTAVLLADGTILSAGGQSIGANYLDGQVYKPGYLFNSDGTLATRPVLSDVPQSVKPGATFMMDVTDAASIKDITFVRNGSSTHDFNPETRALHLSFKMVDADTIAVTLPDNINVVLPGAWMLFAWNAQGTPSIALIIQVEPDHSLSLPPVTADGHNLLVNGDFQGNQFANTWFETFNNEQVKGWNNASGPSMEIEKVGNQQTVDLDVAGAVDQIYQDVRTEYGKIYTLKLDVLKVQAGTSAFDILWNGQVIKSVAGNAAETISLQVAGTGSMDRLSFRELASQNDNNGAKIGNVSLIAATSVIGPLGPNLLVNGDLQGNQFTNTWFDTFTNDQVKGWKNSAENALAIVKVGAKQTLDLDVHNAVDTIYQDVTTEFGRIYTLSVNVVEAWVGTSAFDVLWNGNVVKAYPGDVPGVFTLQVIGTGGTDRLAFREPAGQNDNWGAKITDVSLKATSFIAEPPSVNLLVNGDLQSNPVGTNWFVDFTNDQMKGWKNSAADHVEVIQVGDKLALDLDVEGAVDSIYQDVMTEAGRVYMLKLNVLEAPAGTSAFDIVWNGQVVRAYAGDVPGIITAKVVGTGGMDRLAFTEPAGQNNNWGAKVTDISLKATETLIDTKNLLVNGDLQSNSVGSNWFVDFTNDQMKGWKNAADNQVEVIKVGDKQALDLDVQSAVDSIYQDVTTEHGRVYTLSLNVLEAPVGTSAFNILWNGQLVKAYPGDVPGIITAKVVGTGGTDRLAFAEVAGQNDNWGAKISDISLTKTDTVSDMHGSMIQITAHGAMGNETMVLLIDGQQVATFDNVAKQSSVYTYHSHADVPPAQVRIAFTNDQWDPANGIDSNLIVDKINIDGTDFLTNSPTTYSTGTWTQADNIVPGFGRGDTLATNGYFQYGSPSTGPGSTITIDAHGWTGHETMQLLIDNVVVATYDGVSKTGAVFTYNAGATVTANQIRIAFTNDVYDQATGIDANLTVNKLTVDGKTFLPTDPSVYSTATWTEADNITPGYGRGDTLHTNGYFQFADGAAPAASAHTSLLSNGSFEITKTAVPDGQSYTILSADGVSSWTSTGSVEVWHDGVNNQPGTDGRNVVEIDAGNGALSQMVMTTAGSTYGLSFDLAGRSGAVASSQVEVLWNGNVVTTVAPQDDAFHTYHINLTGTGHDTLTFRSVSGDTDTVGGLLDNVVLHDHALTA